MSYTPTVWVTGDVITDEKLNHLENGIKDNSGFLVTITAVDGDAVLRMDKTYAEIKAVFTSNRPVFSVIEPSEGFNANPVYGMVHGVWEGNEIFYVAITKGPWASGEEVFSCTSEDAYPYVYYD